MKTANKASNPNDLVEVATLKLLIQLEENTGEDATSVKCKQNCSTILTQITDCVNTVLSSGHFPPCMQNGVIVPLYKSGDERQAVNYRPITLLPIMYKLITKIVTERMMIIVEESHALSSMQAGNRKNMSCMVQMNLLLHVIKHAHRNDKPLYIISTDVRKAFDTVAYEAFTKSLR